MSSPSERVKVLHKESESLKTYLSGLSTDAWSKPSACERWTVADVVSHVAGALESYTGNVKRGLQGDSSPPPGRPAPVTWSTASAAEKTSRAEEAAQRVITYRESLGDRLLPTLHGAIDGFHQLLAGLGPQDWDKLCYHARGEIPFSTQVTYAVLEVSLHKWDIQSKLESSAHLSTESLRYLIDHLQEYLHWVFAMDTKLVESACYRFRLTGAVPGEKDVVFDGQQARLAGADSPPVDAVLCCDAEDFLLLMCGRAKFFEVVASGRLVREGGSGLLSELSRWSQAI